jgi:hypothetical protein
MQSIDFTSGGDFGKCPEALAAKVTRLTEKLMKLKQQGQACRLREANACFA